MGKRGPYNKSREKAAKKAFLEAFKKCGGIIAQACKEAGIASRQTIYNWFKSDPDFKAACDEAAEIALDMAESALLRNIQAGDTKAIKFYLMCKGKSRGYDPRQEIDINATVVRPRVVFEEDENDGSVQN